MIDKNWLYKDSVAINENISIRIPTVREILEHEDEYYGLISLLTAMPIDLLVQLDDLGIDYTQINDYELFLLIFPMVQQSDTSMIFGDLDLSKFQMAMNSETNSIVYVDLETNVVIDRRVQQQIATVLRRMHGLKKNTKRPGNEAARDYLLERARKKLRRQRNKVSESQLEPLIVSLVCTEQFKYNYEETKDLSIYQFNLSAKQIANFVEYKNRMFGVYTGNIDAKTLQTKDLTWILQND